MEETISPHHLLIDELNYELRIRNVICNRCQDEKRKILARAFAKEKAGKKVDLSDPNFDFEKERQEINDTIVSITTLILELEGDENDSIFKRARSRLCHVTGRVQRIPNPNNEVEVTTFKNESYATCLNLEADLYERVLANKPTTSTSAFDTSVVGNTTFVPSPIFLPNSSSQTRFVPVYKWGVVFNGDPRQLLPFLEKVSELAEARNVSDKELFSSAADLFSERAFMWYKTVKSGVDSWDSLVKLLKQKFLPPEFDEEIWDDIKVRRQGRKEPVVLYIAVMETLFNRLSRPVAEVTKIKFIRKNLLPEYVSQLALTDITSMKELGDLAERLENAAFLKNKSGDATRKSMSKFLEPELAYVDDSSEASSSGNSRFNSQNRNQFRRKTPQCSAVYQNKNFSAQNKSNIRSNSNLSSNTERTRQNNPSAVNCWNCGLPNHSYSSCTAKRKKFCFKCGTPDVTVSSCNNCSKN